jgi:hypothetical protein
MPAIAVQRATRHRIDLPGASLHLPHQVGLPAADAKCSGTSEFT